MTDRSTVEFLTRRNCPLCDEGWADLHHWMARLGMEATVRDIDEDPVLAADFGERVPVVRAGERVLVEGRWDSADLGRLLRHLPG